MKKTMIIIVCIWVFFTVIGLNIMREDIGRIESMLKDEQLKQIYAGQSDPFYCRGLDIECEGNTAPCIPPIGSICMMPFDPCGTYEEYYFPEICGKGSGNQNCSPQHDVVVKCWENGDCICILNEDFTWDCEELKKKEKSFLVVSDRNTCSFTEP